MGKYMKKSKLSGDVSVMDIPLSPQQSSLGVRTRAKTLALQTLQQQQQQQSQSPDSDSSSSLYYLQLRSRRLEKPPPPLPRRSQERKPGRPSVDSRHASRLSVGSSADLGWELKETMEKETEGCFGNFGCEDFGENNLEFVETRDRSTRESTPCSLIRNSDTIGTPGSTTRRSGSVANNQIVRNETQRAIPTALDIDEFFAQAERQQQNLFIEKYNFDVARDMPLSGRYEWEQVIH